MIVKLLTEHHLEFLSLKGDCRGSSESTHVKMPHYWKSHALAHIIFFLLAQAETVITADQGVRGGKPIELKKMVDEAVASCPCVKRVFVYSRTGADVPMGPKDIYLDKVGQKKCVCCLGQNFL